MFDVWPRDHVFARPPVRTTGLDRLVVADVEAGVGGLATIDVVLLASREGVLRP